MPRPRPGNGLLSRTREDAAGPEHEDLGFSALKDTALIAARLLARGQTNFIWMLWKFNSIYNPTRQLADHRGPVRYAMQIPAAGDNGKGASRDLYILRLEPSRTTKVLA